MGIFDDILICSDWDGTIYYNNEILDKDIEAIRYFQANGGKFTICSGRYYLFLKEFEDKIKPNTNIISLNGAYIAPYGDEGALYEGFLDDRCVDLVERMISGGDEITGFAVNYRKDNETVMYKPEDFKSVRERMRTSELYSIVMYSKSEEDILANLERVKGNIPEGYVTVRSWPRGAEVIMDNNQKGYALKRLKEHLGRRISVAVGDYENDVHMLEMADISYAVGNAPIHVQKSAKRLTVPVWEGALSTIIYELEKEIKAGLL